MENNLKETLKKILDEKKISISFLQREMSLGFNQASRTFNELMDKGMINENGKINKEKIYLELKEEYRPGMKIIFLDIDGVLNCSTTKERCNLFRGIEDQKIALLKEIVIATDALIVLISSWKEHWQKESKLKFLQDELANYLDKKFTDQGLAIIDKIDDDYCLNRGEGILEYLRLKKKKGFKIDKFIILDGEMFDYQATKLTKNLIQTSYYQKGLTRKHVKKALEKLQD